MTDKPDYRFCFQIVDQATGSMIAADWCSLTDGIPTDEFGSCENVDIHVGSLLRVFQRKGRAEYEAANYAPAEEEQQQIGRDKARRTLAEISKSVLLR